MNETTSHLINNQTQNLVGDNTYDSDKLDSRTQPIRHTTAEVLVRWALVAANVPPIPQPIFRAGCNEHLLNEEPRLHDRRGRSIHPQAQSRKLSAKSGTVRQRILCDQRNW
jgi:hypothetical protein